MKTKTIVVGTIAALGVIGIGAITYGYAYATQESEEIGYPVMSAVPEGSGPTRPDSVQGDIPADPGFEDLAPSTVVDSDGHEIDPIQVESP